jgi:hypothetical protein
MQPYSQSGVPRVQNIIEQEHVQETNSNHQIKLNVTLIEEIIGIRNVLPLL